MSHDVSDSGANSPHMHRQRSRINFLHSLHLQSYFGRLVQAGRAGEHFSFFISFNFVAFLGPLRDVLGQFFSSCSNTLRDSNQRRGSQGILSHTL